MKVALVYDRVNKWGGAERVLLALHELFPDAPLYTSVHNPQKASWAKVFDVRSSFLQKFPLASSMHEAYPYLMPSVFESFSFDEYDLVISITSEAAKGIITKPKTMHLCYCLTPTRYLWSGYEDYFSHPLLRFISKPIVSYLKYWDKKAAQRPDVYVAISQEVKKRIKTYYNRDSEVIYPPVTLSTKKKLSAHEEKEPYFLVVSRLVPYKHVELAVRVCTKLNLNLKIIGAGSQEAALRTIAGPTIELLGSLTDTDVIRYYSGSYALIFPGKEDFGLTVLEAQKFGKPVIAYKDGGALETIIEGKTGTFFYPQTEKGLEKTLKRFIKENKSLSRVGYRRKYEKACIEQAKKFEKAIFKKQFLSFIKSLDTNK